ncbi:MAG: STAS domain-containing protein [Acidimicrobiales bacterium]
MSIELEVVVVVTTEQIDHHTAVDFRNELREGLFSCLAGPDPSPELVVDLSQVTFLDSTGIRELIVTERALEHRGSRLVVRGAQGVVRRCLEVTGVLEHFGGASTNGTASSNGTAP